MEPLHEVNPLIGVRVPLLVEHHPYQWEGNAFVNDTELFMGRCVLSDSID